MPALSNEIIIKPQPGFQENFLSSPADIVIGGSGAGVGKTFALLMEPLRHIQSVPGFGGVVFRRTTPQIRNEGGLWDTSNALYPSFHAEPKESTLEWIFPIGNALKFNHLEYDKNILDHQGAQYAFIGFDELTHFSDSQFWYLVGRNRSVCGVNPYIRCTCNPDPDSFVAALVEWWIEQDPTSPRYGLPIPERDGVLRFFIRDNGQMVWGDSKDEVIEKCPHIFDNPSFEGFDKHDLVKSLAFISGSIYDNRELLSTNPQYLGNLLSQDEVTKKQLLDGNWKVSHDGRALFNHVAVSDLESNIVPKGERFITCDVARFGRDLCVIIVWDGYEVMFVSVFTKSSTPQTVEEIERLRAEFVVPKSHVSVDQDGVGGGVVDQGGYVGFSSGIPAMADPGTGIKEAYANLKTQCYYRAAELVNGRMMRVRVDASNCMVDGAFCDVVRLNGKDVKVSDLIRQDLKAIRRRNVDSDGKKQINPKEEQKNILRGRSPDFGDALSQRAFFDLREKEYEPGFYIS